MRVDPLKLRKAIPNEEFDYTLLTSVLSGYSGVRQKIHDLLRSGVIVRVKKGLYVFGPEYTRTRICKEVLANLIYGPSCISMEYALAFHGLIPERVETVTSVTPKKDKTFDTPLGRFTYRYLMLEKYAAGIEQVWIDPQHPVLMATIEKALCDYVALNKIPIVTTYAEARDFLEKDLRIDREHWKQFKPNELRRLNRLYRSKSIEQILDVLEAGDTRR
jgi:predicted transcriptional regulator of viral defense system